MLGALVAIPLLLAAAPGGQEQQAATLFHQSMTEYELGNFDAALDDIAKAYRLEPRPALLYNLGQCHRALHHWERAAFFYSEYLQKNPSAANRPMVEKLIAEMNKKLEAETAAAAKPATPAILVESPAAPPAAPAPAPEPAAAPSPTAASPAPVEATTEPATPPSHGHGLGIGLLSAGLACGVLSGVAAFEILNYNGTYPDAANKSAGSMQYGPTVASAQSGANAWFVVEIVSGILAVAGVATSPFVW